jgi:predicted aldo/keto reductase-like oxidoreductase
MVLDNVKTASETRIGELTQEDQNMLRQVVAAINAKVKVGCTGCGYCMPCPKGVDIPGTFSSWNRYHTESKFAGLREYLMATTFRKTSAAASNCIGCGKCEQHCPQDIRIRDMLKESRKDLEGLLYQAASKASRWFVKF